MDIREFNPNHQCSHYCRNGQHADMVYSPTDDDALVRQRTAAMLAEATADTWHLVALHPAPEAPLPTRALYALSTTGQLLNTKHVTPPGFHPYLAIIAPIEGV